MILAGAFRSCARAAAALVLLAGPGCVHRPVDNLNIIVLDVFTGPNNLDPRIGIDEISQKIGQLVFSNLMDLDERLRVVPGLAERLEHPDPTTYVATLRRGVRFHDGRELTSADVAYTFRCFLDPEFVSPRSGAYRLLDSVDAVDRYTVVFRLKQPFGSFPINLVMPIVPEGADDHFNQSLIGTGPYRFVRYLVDDRVELAAFSDYFGGAPRNEGLIVKIVPDEVMRALELRTGAADIVINDLQPDVVHQLRDEERLQTIEAPGVDYQYVGLNLRDPVLRDVRVRRAIAHAIDQRAIVDHLRRGLAEPARGLLPVLSWAHTPDIPAFEHNPARARELLDAAGYPDPDGDGPAPRLRLTLKVSSLEFNRLQSAVIQQDLREVGVAVDVRTYEFATLHADVLTGNFQMYTLGWVGGAVADPDILYRVFHSSQTPPAGFNRGYFSDARVDALLDQAAPLTDEARRFELFAEVQRLVAQEVPYVSLWHRTNVAVAQRSLTGLHLTPIADFLFLKDVARVRPAAN